MTIQGRFQLERGAFNLDATFTIPGRGVTALFGPSGSGKTTLLRLMAGLERPRAGRFEIDGIVWQDTAQRVFLPPHRRPIGYVFQEAALFPHLTVRGNLEYGYHRTPEPQRRVNFGQAVALAGAGPLLERPAGSLSGGERQRAAIARALLVSPELLLMDEPLASLDQRTKAEILPCFKNLFAELAIPVLYVSHANHEVAHLADHMLLLEDGRVTATGPVNEILTRLDLYPAESEEASAVIEATVIGHDDAYHLTTLAFDGGRLTLPREDQAIGSSVRVAIRARDVSLALERPRDTSILNIIHASVLECTPLDGAQVTVRLEAAGAVLLARITRKSADALRLTPGLGVYVQIKSIGLIEF